MCEEISVSGHAIYLKNVLVPLRTFQATMIEILTSHNGIQYVTVRCQKRLPAVR
jgi:hypothetical protein